MDIQDVGKGLVKQPIDPRDFDFTPIMAAGVPVDFNAPLRLIEPPDENQNGSSSCVGQSTSFLHGQIRGGKWDFSRRDLYARIYLPQGGAYLRDGVSQIVGKGQATRDEVPDPANETEAAMRDKSGVNDQVEASDMEASYFSIANGSIDAIAMAVRDYKGCIFGVYGNNVGWADWRNPVPPVNSNAIAWGHAIYAFGYHLHDGVKCVIAKSSWGRYAAGDGNAEHHIKENYFLSGMAFDGWVVIPKEQQMAKFFKINDHGKLGILIADGFTLSGLYADDADTFKNLLEAYPQITDQTPTIQIP
jgi:hypothetical protein